MAFRGLDPLRLVSCIGGVGGWVGGWAGGQVGGFVSPCVRGFVGGHVRDLHPAEVQSSDRLGSNETCGVR